MTSNGISYPVNNNDESLNKFIFSSINDLSIPDAAPGTTIIEFMPFLSTEIAAEPVFSPFAIIKPSVLTFSFW